MTDPVANAPSDRDEMSPGERRAALRAAHQEWEWDNPRCPICERQHPPDACANDDKEAPVAEQQLPDRIAIDANGFGWRVWDDQDHWSMVPTNPDNELVPQPVAWFVRAGKFEDDAAFVAQTAAEAYERGFTAGRGVASVAPAELAEVLGNTSIDHLADDPLTQWEHIVNELTREGYAVVRRG